MRDNERDIIEANKTKRDKTIKETTCRDNKRQ
jgi:hypothetical protein